MDSGWPSESDPDYPEAHMAVAQLQPLVEPQLRHL